MFKFQVVCVTDSAYDRIPRRTSVSWSISIELRQRCLAAEAPTSSFSPTNHMQVTAGTASPQVPYQDQNSCWFLRNQERQQTVSPGCRASQQYPDTTTRMDRGMANMQQNGARIGRPNASETCVPGRRRLWSVGCSPRETRVGYEPSPCLQHFLYTRLSLAPKSLLQKLCKPFRSAVSSMELR
jgi:hypothetical protein